MGWDGISRAERGRGLEGGGGTLMGDGSRCGEVWVEAGGSTRADLGFDIRDRVVRLRVKSVQIGLV